MLWYCLAVKGYIFIRSGDNDSKIASDFIADLPARLGSFETSNLIEVIDLQTRLGKEKAEVYGVMQHPSLLFVDDQGRQLACWDGRLPLRAEALQYLESGV